MRGVYDVATIRAAEDVVLAERPGDGLMQRAAYALSVECGRLLGSIYGARVVLLVGAGNNGGDALYAGAYLARRGAAVTALLLDPDRAHVRGLIALRSARGRIAAAEPAYVGGADLVIDGILGIGGRGGLRPEAAALARAARGRLTVAVDLPSGVDAGSGEAGEEAVRADVTVTFGGLKPGLLVGRGAELAGEVRLVDLGLALPAPKLEVLEASDVRAAIRQPEASDDKYTRGVVGVVAGSPQYGGAGVLATGAALAGGAGMVRYAGLAAEQIRARFPEVVVHPDSRPHELRVQSWVVGPGLGVGGTARGLLADVLAAEVPVLVDADAITMLADSPELLAGRQAVTVITPHDREFARIAGPVGGDRVAAAQAAAAKLGVTVLLKGSATVVAAPDGSVFLNPTGTPWLATAGSGDVLSGLIGSLLASGLAAPLAAAVGAYLHGVAGQLAAANGPPSAPDILDALRPAIRSVISS
jgi:ADP-dependent NAD(P)H-hydrate dehydratase / NAD(P)H-hydrate epimerase